MGRGSWSTNLKGKHTVDGEGRLEIILTGRDNFGEEFRWEIMRVDMAYGRNQRGSFAGAEQWAEAEYVS